MFKKCLSIMLVFVLVLCILPTAAFASEIVAEGTCGDNLTWVLTEDGTFTVSGTGTMTDFDAMNNVPWIDLRSQITTVVIEPGVESIGCSAFTDCENLTSVTIPEGVTSIGISAFADCSALDTIVMPDSVTLIDSYAFSKCPLDYVIIPAGVTELKYSTFRFCGLLTSVNLPVSVTSIQTFAFSNCNLQHIYYEGTEEQWAAITIADYNAGMLNAEVHYNSARTQIGPVPNVIEGTCGDSLTWNFDRAAGMLTISGSGAIDEVTGNYTGKVVYCPWYGFGRLVQTLVIGEGITAIGSDTFVQFPNLTNATIPTSITEIEADAFYSCTSLQDVYYLGTVDQWNAIAISREYQDGNANLVNANIHFAGSFVSVDDTIIEVEGVSGLSAGAVSDADKQILDQAVTNASLEKYVAYDITANITDETAVVSIPVPGDWDTDRLVGVSVEDGVLKQINGEYEDGSYTFEVDHFSAKGVAQLPGGETESIDAFTDVPVGSYYADPVIWAVENGITTGSSDTTFNPTGDCLRAQVVTFLWRAAGEPEPTSTNNPFTDVDEGDWYYDAVLWAVEKGITTGTSETTFSPTAKCNRAQTVTFLYRAMGEPEYSATTSPFTDVKPSAWYGPAVLWAVENEITNGMDATTFCVNGICNRAQVVTFLYRAYN